jgi:hypothetical protein
MTMNKYLREIIAFTAAFAISSTAAVMAEPSKAASFPFPYHNEQNIDQHQVGYVDVVIQPDGSGSVTTKWSNGKQWAGNNFYSVVYFIGNDKKPMTYVSQQKGIDGSWGGHAREASETNQFKLSQEQLAAFDHIEWRVGALRCGMKFDSINSNGEIVFKEAPCDAPRELKMPSHRRDVF